MNLWTKVMIEYALQDAAGMELLCSAAEALDRAQHCREIIDKDGAVVQTKNGPKEHPLLKIELGNRALLARLIGRLGLDVEPLRIGAGRPPGIA